MLISYSIANFKSFRERQTLSLIAATKLQRKENTFLADVDGESLMLLKTAAVYGPNASGKSNLLRALSAVQEIVGRTPTAGAQKLPASPFRFDPELANKPSEFCLNFIAERQRFSFTLAATADRIVREELVAFPKGRQTLLYNRTYDGSADRYVFGAHFEADQTLREAWQRLTAPQQLFLSQAVANSNEQLKQLRPPLAWLQSNLMVVPARAPIKQLAKFTHWLLQQQLSVAQEAPEFLPNQAVSFIRELDIPITGLRIEPENTLQMTDTSPAGIQTFITAQIPALANAKTWVTHASALGDAVFSFEEESEGTQNLFGFYLLWLMLKAKNSPMKLLTFDEFDTSLHPQIVAKLIKLHNNSPSPSQLLFSTHDTHLMDAKILRRDQLWLTERDANCATRLRSIYDFEGRESEDIEKRYYEGRYRGLPILRGE